MSIFYYFIIAFFISAIGTLPTGLITLTIMQRTLEAGKKAGIMLSLGATIMEFAYTYIALYCISFFQENMTANRQMTIFTMLIFFAFGLYNFLKKSKPTTTVKSDYHYFDFARGFLIALMNVLIIPFWLFIALWLATCEIVFDTQWKVIIFSLGASLGALAIFIVYTELGHFILTRIGKFVRFTNKIVGTVFILLGIYQLTQLF